MYEQVVKERSMQDDKNYSWQGSPNAGSVLTILALVGAVVVLLAGFSY